MKYGIHIQLSVKHSTLTFSPAGFVPMKRRDSFNHRPLVAGSLHYYTQISFDEYINIRLRHHKNRCVGHINKTKTEYV